MFCKKCGNQIDDGLEKCPFCGEPLDSAETGGGSSGESGTEVGEGAVITNEDNKKASENQLEKDLNSLPETAKDIQGKTVPDFSEVTVLGEKPKKTHKKAWIIAVCAAILLIAAGVTAKTYFARDIMRTFMGNGKYLQSSESSTVNVMLDKSVGGMDNVKMASLQSGNTAYSSVASIKVNLDGTAKSQLGTQFDTIINFINSISFKSTNYADGKSLESNFSISHKSNKLLSGSYYFSDGGTQIFQFPEISNTYLVSDTATKLNPLDLKYDSDKLKASMQGLAKIYTDEILNGKVSVKNNQTVTVSGISVNAEKISVTLSGKQLKEMYKKMLETVKNDDYIYTFISNNYDVLPFGTNMNGTVEAPTKKEFQSKCDTEIKGLESSSSNVPGTLMVSAYVEANNTQVARSYEYTNSSTGEKNSLNMVFVNENGMNKYAFNVKTNGKDNVDGFISFNSSNSGSAELSLKDNNGGNSAENKIKIDFSNIKKESFAGGNVLTGTYGITFDIPSENSGDSSFWQTLSNMSVKAVTGISGGKENAQFTVSVKNAANVKIKVVNTPVTAKTITVPKVKKDNEVFLNDSKNTNIELQNKYGEEVSKYFMSLPAKDKDLADIMTTLFYGGIASGAKSSTLVS